MSDQNIGNVNMNLGFEESMFVSTESTFGSQSAPSAADAVHHLSVKLGYKIEEKYLEEKKPHRGVEGAIEGRGSGEWSAEMYLRPTSTSGAPGELDSLLACIFPDGNSIGSSAIQASPTPTTLQFDVDSAADMADDDLMLVPLSSGGRVVRLDVTSNTLAVQPALPVAPAGTETPAAAYCYHLTTKPTSSLTIARKGSFFAEWATGCWVNKMTVKLVNSPECKISFDGGYQDKSYAHADTLAAAIAAADGTSMTVSNPYKFRASSTCPAYVQIDNEVVKIVAVNTTTGVCTIERAQYSTAGATHDNGATISAYMPTPSYTTVAPLTGLAGKVRFAESALIGTDLYVTEVEISIDNKCKAINGPFGTSNPQGYVTAEKREVSCKLTAYATYAQMEYWGRAFSRNTFADIVAQVGTEAGACFAACLPQVHFPTPDLDTSKAEELTFSLEGRALCDSTGNDELILGWF